MSTLTLDQWLEEYVPLEVQIEHKPPFIVGIDLSAIGPLFLSAAGVAFSAGSQLSETDPSAGEAALLQASHRFLARAVKTFNGTPITPADVERLGLPVCEAVLKAFFDAFYPNALSSAGSKSPSKDEDSAPDPGGTT